MNDIIRAEIAVALSRIAPNDLGRDSESVSLIALYATDELLRHLPEELVSDRHRFDYAPLADGGTQLYWLSKDKYDKYKLELLVEISPDGNILCLDMQDDSEQSQCKTAQEAAGYIKQHYAISEARR